MTQMIISYIYLGPLVNPLTSYHYYHLYHYYRLTKYQVPDTALEFCLHHFIMDSRLNEVVTINILTLWMRQLMFNEAKEISQDSTEQAFKSSSDS